MLHNGRRNSRRTVALGLAVLILIREAQRMFPDLEAGMDQTLLSRFESWGAVETGFYTTSTSLCLGVEDVDVESWRANCSSYM